MKLLIRADADSQSGSGHVMRGLALAQAWQDAGGSAILAAARLPESLRERLQSEGVDVVADEDIVRVAREHDAMWVAVDGYHFGAAYQRRLKDAGLRVLWIDDQGRDGPYCADLVLNQNLHADAITYDGPARLLLGPRYVLLRREFRTRRERAAGAKNVLVTLGGADPHNVTMKVVRALQQLPDVEALVIAGGSNPHYDVLREATRDTPRIRLERSVADMPALMSHAGIAVAAGGTTCWELAFCGLPSIVIALAENQLDNVQRLGDAGIAMNLGWHEHVDANALAAAIEKLIADGDLQKEMSRRGMELIDGEGGARVVEQMLGGGLALRPVREDDCRLLYEWANDPIVRAQSFSSRPIEWDEHSAWFRARLDDAASLLYVAVDGDSSVGQIRYDVNGKGAVVSVSVADGFRGRGYASRMIRLGSQKLFATNAAAVIHAYVKTGNTASLQAFRNAGFSIFGTEAVRGEPAVHLTLERGEH